jgi:glutamate/aspartate transport system substrate-binding protein
MTIGEAGASKGISLPGSVVRAACAAFFVAFSGAAMAAGTLDKVAQTGVLTLGYQQAPPFSDEDEAKRPIGYSVDICMKVAEAVKRELKRPDIAVKFVKVSPVTRYSALLNGEIDLECANTANTVENRKRFAFTVPTFVSITRMMVREGSKIKTFNDLEKTTVVTIWGSNIEKVFDETNAKFTLRASNLITNDFEGAFSVMETDKADAFIMEDVLLYTMLAASKNKTKYVVTKDALNIQPLSLMLRKDDPAFKKVVDTEVTRVIVQGEIYSIYQKWFESPTPPRQLNLKLPMPYVLRDSFKTPTDWVPPDR